jgi:hypothetical protein
MKAKDLINLLFKVEESKEMQESLFYNQYGTITNFIQTMTKNEMNKILGEQLTELHKIAIEMQKTNPLKSEGIIYTINKISTNNAIYYKTK